MARHEFRLPKGYPCDRVIHPFPLQIQLIHFARFTRYRTVITGKITIVLSSSPTALILSSTFPPVHPDS